MKTLKKILTVAIIVAGFSASAQLTGRQIVDKAYNLPSGDDQTSQLTMTLVNKSGQTRGRKKHYVLFIACRCKKHIVYELELR